MKYRRGGRRKKNFVRKGRESRRNSVHFSRSEEAARTEEEGKMAAEAAVVMKEKLQKYK